MYVKAFHLSFPTVQIQYFSFQVFTPYLLPALPEIDKKCFLKMPDLISSLMRK